MFHEEETLAQQIQNDINIVWDELGDKTLVVEKVVIFFNSRPWNELHDLGVRDRT